MPPSRLAPSGSSTLADDGRAGSCEVGYSVKPNQSKRERYGRVVLPWILSYFGGIAKAVGCTQKIHVMVNVMMKDLTQVSFRGKRCLC